jgi:hypothetical protein
MGPTEIIALNLACALIGFLIGNWLAIGRDRRAEFKELVKDIHADLVSIKINPNNILHGAWIITFALIREKLPFWQRKGFDRAVEAYKQSKSTYSSNRKPDGMGGFMDGETSAEDRAAISHAAADLLKYLKPR